MKFVKIMIIASAFYLTYAHAREIHQAVDEPAAPYNLRWGMSYDEARNTPLYSLEVSDINYAGKDPDLIISTLTPQEVGALKYQEMKLYFDQWGRFSAKCQVRFSPTLVEMTPETLTLWTPALTQDGDLLDALPEKVAALMRH